jgi:uncharacterized paraquat-inducible protein A
MTFNEIVELLDWDDATQLTALVAFIEDKGLWDDLNDWAEKNYADEIDAKYECTDCQGTGIGNPHIDHSRCSVCGGSGRKRPDSDGDPDL